MANTDRVAWQFSANDVKTRNKNKNKCGWVGGGNRILRAASLFRYRRRRRHGSRRRAIKSPKRRLTRARRRRDERRAYTRFMSSFYVVIKTAAARAVRYANSGTIVIRSRAPRAAVRWASFAEFSGYCRPRVPSVTRCSADGSVTFSEMHFAEMPARSLLPQ